ncbi:MAG: Fic family protein [Candidatus Altiarchaeales archaeon]|nr:Fic family protein [Candidatus Altiarchaeota archaeon]MBU4341820.1 Fic family protein [Candidatus Altiarchaeota archaeon]MBU4406433.1 Fic family protein [Candidatus Altiarchaeota archaeon]MBU4437477.1 Fic family protein [Candidatus Altiarchaeota archaeon]MCG2782713.1 Fic family protein [Candidatus Altiarchaeales archaeon]
MKDKLIYPTVESVKFVNRLVNLMSNMKADQHKLLMSDSFIATIIEKAREDTGDVYTKGAILLRDLIIAHGFESGNKRTAFVVTVHFINSNGGSMRAKNFNKAEKILRNIRRYDLEDLSHWLRTGDINESKT